MCVWVGVCVCVRARNKIYLHEQEKMDNTIGFKISCIDNTGDTLCCSDMSHFPNINIRAVLVNSLTSPVNSG